MCLSKITEQLPIPTDKVVKAYKIVYLRNGALYPWCYTPSGIDTESTYARSYKFDYWYKANKGNFAIDTRDANGNHTTYTPGFHVFPTLKDANNFSSGGTMRVVPVLVKGVHSLGTQMVSKVMVAEHMMFPKQDVEKRLKVRLTKRR